LQRFVSKVIFISHIYQQTTILMKICKFEIFALAR
jgi:hypothetical protein